MVRCGGGRMHNQPCADYTRSVHLTYTRTHASLPQLGYARPGVGREDEDGDSRSDCRADNGHQRPVVAQGTPEPRPPKRPGWDRTAGGGELKTATGVSTSTTICGSRDPSQRTMVRPPLDEKISHGLVVRAQGDFLWQEALVLKAALHATTRSAVFRTSSDLRHPLLLYQ